MNIFISQLKKLTNFIYILMFLFIGAVVFNINYKWEGISIILRVYLFIFSFYIVYIFSRLDLETLKNEFQNKYGRKGLYILFFYSRIAPFLTIYFTIILLTFINYIGSKDWPWEPIIGVLSGRFSNTLIYSLILLLILKVKKSPKVTIPLFLIFCVGYFILYKVVYNFSPTGVPTTILKILNLIIIIFILFYEFFYNKMNLLMISFHTLVLTLAIHFSVVGCFYMINRFSTFGSYGQIRSATLLLKMGYSFPLKQVKTIIKKSSNFYLINHLIYYSKKYNKNIDFSIEEWENMMFSDTVSRADLISRYLLDKIRSVSYGSLITFAEMKSNKSGKDLINAQYFIKYSAKYYEEFMEDFSEKYEKGNIYFKLWVLKVIGEAKIKKSIPFLIDKLTDLNLKVSEVAYQALKNMTLMEFAERYKVKINNPIVVREYRAYYENISIDD